MKMLRCFVLAGVVLSPFAAYAEGDCSQMMPEMQQFASQLTPENQAMFCGQMTDAQRSSAMQMSSSMTPDQAVQKAMSGGATTTNKMPAGCPVK